MSGGDSSGRTQAASNGQQPQATRQYVQFVFYKVDNAWRRLPLEERESAKQEAVAAIESFADRMQVRAYTLVGIRGDADFMLWHISDDIELFQRAGSALHGTKLGAYLTTPHAFLAMTRKSVYVDKGEPSAAARRLRISPGTSKYLFVYPFVKTRPWYNLSQEQRQSMMDTHIRIGRKYPSVKLNTTYSFGLDDQEFVVSFETDEPGDFLDLVMELRETESSLYTLRDTPTFTCVATTPRGALDALGASARVARESSSSNVFGSVIGRADALADGTRKVIHVGGEQVLLFKSGGTIYATDARCPHANAPLETESTIDGTTLTCDRHGSQFDLASGCEITRGPAGRPLRMYDVRIDHGDIVLGAPLEVVADR